MISQLVWKRLFKTQMLLASFMILNHFYGPWGQQKEYSWKPHPKRQPCWNCREMKLQVKFTHACLTSNNLLVLSLPQTHIYTDSGHKQLKSNTSINHNESFINSSDIHHLETILKSATCWNAGKGALKLPHIITFLHWNCRLVWSRTRLDIVVKISKSNAQTKSGSTTVPEFKTNIFLA
jgi:hypothetical protein